MRKLLIILFFLIVTPLTLFFSVFGLMELQKPVFSQQAITEKLNDNLPVGLYAALPEKIGQVLGVASSADARPVIVKQYLKAHSSPLLPYSNEIIAAADRYQIDYRLIIAIGQCESNLCKKSPEGSFNCWGFENGKTRFLSWQQALDQVAKTLKEGYIDQGLTTPEEIMPKYAPPSVDKGGPWAKCVNQFMEELEFGKID